MSDSSPVAGFGAWAGDRPDVALVLVAKGVESVSAGASGAGELPARGHGAHHGIEDHLGPTEDSSCGPSYGPALGEGQ